MNNTLPGTRNRKSAWKRAAFQFLAAYLLWATISSPALAAKTDFTQLESISSSYEEVCGFDLAGKVKCQNGNDTATWIPDAVGKLTSAFENLFFACGTDSDGWQCWKMAKREIAGLPLDQKIRTFLGDAKPNSIRLSRTVACSVSQHSGQLHCLTPYSSPEEFYETPKTAIRTLGVNESYVCWADGDLINCRGTFPPWNWPKKMEIANPFEIALGNDYICARSLIESKCWSQKSQLSENAVATSPEILSAKQWLPRENSLCALTNDHRVVCSMPSTGKTFDHQEKNNLIPLEYVKSNPEIQNIWTSAFNACIQLKNGSVTCWSWWNLKRTTIEFREPVATLFSSGEEPCAILLSGQAECRFAAKTLPNNDKVRIVHASINPCYWNAGGIDCQGFKGYQDQLEFKSIKHVSASDRANEVCVVGVPRGSIDDHLEVRCIGGYDTTLSLPPILLKNPMTVAISEKRACAASDSVLLCWGKAFFGKQPPSNILNPKKLLMTKSHACLMDEFGFDCWGDLADHELEVPSELNSPGRVVDFALGDDRTCVVLNSGSVECWGRSTPFSVAPPALTGATSIVGRDDLFCALASTGLHCWSQNTGLPR